MSVVSRDTLTAELSVEIPSVKNAFIIFEFLSIVFLNVFLLKDSNPSL